MSLDPRTLLAGRRIFVTGASGFLGKVWLAHVLSDLPETRLTLLLRPGRGQGSAGERAWKRLADLLQTSPAFRALHEKLGADELARRVENQIEVEAGDVGLPGLGLSQPPGPLDLVLHLAGLTDLDPDLEPALAINVDGALGALELARASGAQLIHVSTAYVAGRRRGVVAERIQGEAPAAPAGAVFDPAREREGLSALLEAAQREVADPLVQAELARRATAARGRLGLGADAQQRLVNAEERSWVAARATDEAAGRARAWGWPNLYTETKALAEALLDEQRGEVALTVVRPTIVEAAWRDPFPGWKEGLHTSAPLTYALTHGPLRALPAREDLVLDVVPVDQVARGLSLACAAALDDPPSTPRVLHLGSSASNPFNLRQVIELTALGHRRMQGRGQGPFRWRELLALDPSAAGDALYEAQIPLVRRLARGGQRALRELSEIVGEGRLSEGLRRGSRRAGRAARDLERVEEVVERFRPFVREHEQVFASDEIEALSARLVPSARACFAWNVPDLDWTHYWTRIHLPGLQTWIYPRIEGRCPPPEPRRSLVLKLGARTSSNQRV